MRITCPNCGAQYEVDDALIPESGRDVQCSNCGKGWFQPRHAEGVATRDDDTVAEAEGGDREPEAAAVEVEEPDATSAEADEEHRDAPVAHAAREAPEQADATHDERTEDADADAELGRGMPQDEMDDEESMPPPAPAVTPRKPDEAVLSVLREEAQREIAKRREEAGTIESQPDLGLSEPPERRTGPSAAEIAAGSAVAANARRDLLPDIDEINSTLRPDADRSGAAVEEEEDTVVGERRRGFRLGFGLMLLLAAVLIGLYVGAGWLSATFPAFEPVLIAYVEAANGLRAWIDGLLESGVDAMSG